MPDIISLFLPSPFPSTPLQLADNPLKSIPLPPQGPMLTLGAFFFKKQHSVAKLRIFNLTKSFTQD